MTGKRRVVLALPADAHGRRLHTKALEAVKAAFEGCEVVGPDRRWDTILTPVAAGSKVQGAHALVFAAWQGFVSRGVFELAMAAQGLPGGALAFDGDGLKAEWTLTPLEPAARTRRRYAALQ